MTNGLYRCFSGLGLGSCFSLFGISRRSNHNATNQDTKASADLVFVGSTDSENVNRKDDGSVNNSSNTNSSDGATQPSESDSITFTTPVPPLDSSAGPDLSQSLATNQSQNGFLLQQSDQNPASELTLPSNNNLVLSVESEPDEIASSHRSNADNQSSKSPNDLYSSTGSQDQRTLIRSTTPRVLTVRPALVVESDLLINTDPESVMSIEVPTKPGAEPANSLNRNSPSLTTPRELDIEGLEGKLKLAEIDLSTKLKMSSLEFDAPRNPSPIPLEPKINFSINPQNNVSLVSQEERQFSTTPDGVFLLNNQQAREFESQRKAEALQIFAIPSTNLIRPTTARNANNNPANCLWV
jgi:hypothetical protein